MRRTDYKVDKIKVFINVEKPTRSELIKFIAVKLNGIDEVYFNKHKRSFRGYYATNIGTMRSSGNIASDKNGKYYVTKQGLKNENSLYKKPYKEQVKDLRKQLRRSERYNRSKIKDLRAENRELYMKVKELEATLYHINMLSK